MRIKKKRFTLIISLVLILTGVLIPLQAQSLGDVNSDGNITIVDALMTAQYYVGLNPSPFAAWTADADCSGAIDIVDALMIAQYYVGLISSFPCSATPTPTPVVTVTPTSPLTPDPTGGTVSCAGYPVWNSNVIYSASGTLVQYNCKLYRNSYFTFGNNPEEVYVDQYSTWVLQGACGGDCTMGEGPWVACGKWDKWAVGGYTIYNNIWGGDAAGTQCIWANSHSNWGVRAVHPNTGGVKSYPNASKNINRSVSTLGSLSSSFNVRVPAGGAYATTYDIWADNRQYEIMIWVNYTGAVGPIAGAWNDDGIPVAEATNVALGGHTWNVYKGNIGFTVISFLRTTNTNSGTVNVKAIVDYIRSRGWFGDVIIGDAQFGFEITSSVGGLDFTVNSYNMN